MFFYEHNNLAARTFAATHHDTSTMNRQQRIDALTQNKEFDLLVIGGGATGCGVAVDAASRWRQASWVKGVREKPRIHDCLGNRPFR